MWLDHEAVGIYGGTIEPTYDLRVAGKTEQVLAAATEFGLRHTQEAVLIARQIGDEESDPGARFGITITLQSAISAAEAVVIATMVQSCGLKGATFVPKRGTVAVYHTEDLGMSPKRFDAAAAALVRKVVMRYPESTATTQKYIIQMRQL